MQLLEILKNSKQLWIFLIFNFSHFAKPTFQYGSGRQFNSSVKIMISLWQYVLKLKQFAVSYLFQYWIAVNVPVTNMDISIQHK